MKWNAVKLTLTLVIACFNTAAHSQTMVPPGATPGTSDSSPVVAPTGELWRVMVSPYTYHYSYNPEHRHVYMIGLERQYAGGFVVGGSWFRNSFGQPSAYVYAGRRFDHFSRYEPLFAQLTAGVLYGYKPPFENKVPLNHNGFSPGAVLSLGWQFTPMYSAQLNLLGNSALMFQFSADFR